MMKKIVLGISVGVSLLISLILSFVITGMSGSLASQQAAMRWSESGGFSQISCFFSVNSRMSEEQLLEFGHSIDGALAEASIVQNSENPSARLWVDAYSASGTLTISTEKGRISSASAIGVGGDFFLFHPMDLLYGSYFNGASLFSAYYTGYHMRDSTDIHHHACHIIGTIKLPCRILINNTVILH